MNTPSGPREHPLESRLGDFLSSAHEHAFDIFATLAAHLCDAPYALVSFADDRREWVKGSFGVTLEHFTYEPQFSLKAMLGNQLFEAHDAAHDSHTRQHPVLIADPSVCYYVGVPLITPTGVCIGALSICDRVSRELSPERREALVLISKSIVDQFELLQTKHLFKQRIEVLSESERRFRSIADASPMLLWISDDAGNRTFFNKAWCEFTGLSREESIVDGWQDVVHPDDRELYHRKWKEAAYYRGRFQLEFRLKHSTGIYRWVMEQAMPLVSAAGRVEAYVSSCLDLSSRNADELRGQSNEARFRAVSEAAPLGIFVTDSDGHFIYTNHRFQEITGQRGEESLGSGWLKAIPKEDRDRIQTNWYAATRAATCFEELHRYLKPDGKLVWCNVKAAAINSTDTVSGWVGTVEDITSRLQTEAELRAAKQAAEAAMHSKGQFLAHMSHEIRTPLTAIIGFAEALHREDDCSADEQYCVKAILNNGRHLLEIVSDILDLSKIDAGALTIERTSCDLLELLEEVRTMFASRIAEKALSFTINYEWPLPRHITTDPLRLKQVIINLLSNAIKFTDHGWIDIQVRFDSSAKRLCFTVSDSGIGMTAEQQQKLFRPFLQADEAINRKYGGTGLGLTISQTLVHALGGTIEASSQPGRGSQFSFFIVPEVSQTVEILTSMPALKQSKSPESGSLPRLQGKVLFADDVLDNRRLVQFLLKKVGVEPTLAQDGKEAVDAALTEPFDLIILDVQMPVLDGLSAARVLRAGGIKAPIVALSAGSMSDDVFRAIEAGCSMHVSKPFTSEVFFNMVSRFLKHDSSSRSDTAIIVSDRLDFDPEMIPLVIDFTGRLPLRLRELSGNLEAGNIQVLESLAHKLKGSAGLYGFPQVSEIAAQLELAAIESNLSAAREALDTLSRTIEGVMAGREILLQGIELRD
jgi:PAS domain S-box-containing protein